MFFLGLLRVSGPAGHQDGQAQARRDSRPREGCQDCARRLELWQDQVLHAPARDSQRQPWGRDCLAVRQGVQVCKS